MNTAVSVAKPTRTDVFIGQVLPPDRLRDIVSSMPSHVKPERFQRNLVVAITQHPRLLECNPVQVFNEVSKAAALGLYLDPQLGEAYLITGFSDGRYVPQLRLGYRGLIKLARQSGEVSDVYAHDVCANDKFRMKLGTDKTIDHEPDYMHERGEIGLYYAVVKFTNGSTDFEPMSIKEIHRIRDRSDGWRAFQAKKIKSTPWATDEGEMSKKTVLRRLLKRIPQSPELADALRIEDADFTVDAEVVNRPSLSSRLASQIGHSREGFSLEHVQIETGSTDARLQPNDTHDALTGEVIDTASSDSDNSNSSQVASFPAADTPAPDPTPLPQSGAGTSHDDDGTKQEPTDADMLRAFSERLFQTKEGGPNALKVPAKEWRDENNRWPDATDKVNSAKINKIYGAHSYRITNKMTEEACRAAVEKEIGA